MLWVERLTLYQFPQLRARGARRRGPSRRCSSAPTAPARPTCSKPSRCWRPGQGMRRAAYPDLARGTGDGGWAVAAHTHTHIGPIDIGTGLLAENADVASARAASCASTARRAGAGALADYVEMVWVTPAMDGLFTGPGSERRRFLDRLILCFDPGYRTRRRPLRARHAAAQPPARRRRARRRALRGPGDASWRRPASPSRRRAPRPLRALGADHRRAHARAIPTRRSPGRGPAPGRRARSRPRTHARGRGRGRLRAARCAQAASATAPPGARWMARTAPISLVAPCAQGDAGAALLHRRAEGAADRPRPRARRARRRAAATARPILLLDEITAHLDADRRAALFDEILRLGGQAWMTGTDAQAFSCARRKGPILARRGRPFDALSQGRPEHGAAAAF